MTRWPVLLHDEFAVELCSYDREILKTMLKRFESLALLGPELGRPAVDTLKGSRFANLKEMRFSAAGGTWRVVFAFDPRRRAIILAGGNKAGVSQRLFYKRLINIAEERFASHLSDLG